MFLVDCVSLLRAPYYCHTTIAPDFVPGVLQRAAAGQLQASLDAMHPNVVAIKHFLAECREHENDAV